MYKTQSSIRLVTRHFQTQISLLVNSNPKPKLQFFVLRFVSSSSDQSWLSIPGKPIINWPHQPFTFPNSETDLIRKPDPNPNFSQNEFSIVSDLLRNPIISPGSSFHDALDRTGIEPGPSLLQAVFDHFDSSPKLLHSLFLWAEKKPGFRPTETLFSSMINVLAKSRGFDYAWSLILERIGGEDEEPTLVSGDAFVIMIRRYARAGTFLLLYIVLSV